MRFLCSVLVLFVFAVIPCLSGCDSQQSETDTPIEASDTDATIESPVNDADNP